MSVKSPAYQDFLQAASRLKRQVRISSAVARGLNFLDFVDPGEDAALERAIRLTSRNEAFTVEEFQEVLFALKERLKVTAAA